MNSRRIKIAPCLLKMRSFSGLSKFKYSYVLIKTLSISDPHFVIQSGNERICFDQYGLDGDDIVLLFDPLSGLKVTGKVFETAEKKSLTLTMTSCRK